MLTFHKYLKRFFTWDYALTFWMAIIIFVVPLFSLEFIKLIYRTVFSIIYILAALTVLSYSRKVLYVSIGLFLLEWLSYALGLNTLLLISNSLTILFYTFIVVIFVARISKSKRVTVKVIIEGINGYLLLVLMFSMLTGILMFLDAGSFFYSIDPNPNYNLSDMIYYTMVTMTTLGYGDIIPVTPPAKSLTMLIAGTGQFYMAILVAMLVGKFIAQQKYAE